MRVAAPERRVAEATTASPVEPRREDQHDVPHEDAATEGIHPPASQSTGRTERLARRRRLVHHFGVLPALLLGALLAGCPPPSSADGGTGGGGGGGSTGGGGGGGSGGSGGGSGGGTVTTDGGQAYAPELTSVTARVSGRTGKDLSVSVTGKDRNLDAVTVWVRLLDAQDAPVTGLDTNRDGLADAAEGVLTLEGKRWVGEVVTGTATVRGLFGRAANVVKVGVKLMDATSLQSAEQLTTIVEQPVRTLGTACDATFVTDRCEPGLGCRGTPTVCSEGLAPAITRLAFYRSTTSAGPYILVEGTEPEDDLSNLHFDFQDAQGHPAVIDLDGDGTEDVPPSFDHPSTGLAVDGTFFVRLPDLAVGLDQKVQRLVAIPSDLAGHTGDAGVTTPTNIPVRNAGQSCDARGFDICAANLSCSPGTVGAANTCKSASPLRTAECSAATLLIPSAAGTKVVGVAEGGSLWDAPEGCSTNNPTGRPEGVVKLRLAQRADRLVLSTIGPSTGFDTTLYVLSGCPDTAADALGCADDARDAGTSSSILVLTDLPAGDYLVVVDSFDLTGGTFELTATLP